jgi:hypothetical protein
MAFETYKGYSFKYNSSDINSTRISISEFIANTYSGRCPFITLSNMAMTAITNKKWMMPPV